MSQEPTPSSVEAVRAELLARHAEARRRRQAAPLGSPEYQAAADEVARIEIEIARLERNRQIVFRYVSPAGDPADEANPNGSVNNIAGICNETRNVVGLMPHPERHIDPTHHPRWTRHERREVGDGFRLFQNAIAYFR